jgi:hypothetical protein
MHSDSKQILDLAFGKSRIEAMWSKWDERAMRRLLDPDWTRYRARIYSTESKQRIRERSEEGTSESTIDALGLVRK